MNFYSRPFLLFPRQARRWLAVIGVLVVANVMLWATYISPPLLPGSLYSLGVAFKADGSDLTFSDKLMFGDDRVNYAIKVNWDGKSNTMQEAGVASRGLRGQVDVLLKDVTSFGPSLLSEGVLEEEFAFNRSYMQGGHAQLSLLPLSGDFQDLCFYLIYLKKVYCGGKAFNVTQDAAPTTNP